MKSINKNHIRSNKRINTAESNVNNKEHRDLRNITKHTGQKDRDDNI